MKFSWSEAEVVTNNFIRALHIMERIIIQEASFTKQMLDELQSNKTKDGDFMGRCLQLPFQVYAPKRFGGKQDNFEEISFKFKAYLSIMSAAFKTSGG